MKSLLAELNMRYFNSANRYKIYNHGEDCPYPEYQVEFERGTKFEITDIKKGKEYNVVHIKELPSQTI